MTQTDWAHLGILVEQYIPWLVPFVAACVAFVTRLAPFITDKRVQALAAQGVAAAEQTIGDPAQRYAYVDGLLHDLFPRLSPDQRHAAIEGAVTALHMAIGTFTSATPPTPTQSAQAAQAQSDLAELQKVVGDLAAVVQAQQSAPRTTKLTRTPGGQFSASAAPVAVSSPAPEAAHTYPSTPAGG